MTMSDKTRLRHGLFGSLLGALLLTTPAPAQEANSVYSIQADGLACPFCAYGIEKQLNAIDGVAAIEIEIKTGTITITMRNGFTLDEEAANRAVEKAGFSMRNFKQPGEDG